MNQNQARSDNLGIGTELRDHLGTILRYWWLVILLPAVGGLLAGYYSSTQDTLYRASSTILVQYRGSGLDVGLSDSSKSRELSATYRRLIVARPFLERVDRFGASISATTGTNPPTISIHATHGNAVTAAAVAQQLSESFIGYAIELRLTQIARIQAAASAQGIGQIENLIAAQLSITDNLLLLEPVSPPGSPIVPQTRRNIQVGVFLGLFSAVGLALLLNSFRETVRSPEDLERRFGSISLGVIQQWSGKDISPRSLMLDIDPKSNYSESYRKLRSSLQFANSAKSRSVIMVASPSPAEGKSTILSNLAVANVFTGLRVLVIDADLRRPTIHSIFKVPRETAGLSNYLSDPKIDVKEVISATAIGVDIVTSGPIPPNPAELLSSPRMNSMIGHAKSSYDVVFVDSPPLLVVADGPIIASQVHGVVVVVDAFETRPSALRGALRLINDSGGDVVGVVINKHRNKFMRTGYYYYQYHDYGYDTYYYENGADTPQNGLSGRIKKMWSRIGPSD